MREKSQIEDMRAAVRGDLERARARREADPWRPQQPESAGPQGLTPDGSVPTEAREPEPGAQGLTPEGSVPTEALEPQPTPDPEPESEQPAEAAEEPPEPIAAPPPATEPAAQDETAAAQRGGFFARLFGR